MITECPFASEACPHYSEATPYQLAGVQEHGCYANTDHVIPRAMGRRATASALLRNYINTPANQVQKCLWEHEAKTNEDNLHPPQIPSEQFMINAIKRARSRE